MQNQGVIWSIAGMTCEHCEKTIKNDLSILDGVQTVKVSLAQNSVAIRFDAAKISQADLIRTIEQAGYSVVRHPTTKKQRTLRAIGLMTIMIALYLVLDQLGVFTFIPEVTAGMSYLMLFAVGVLTSFHCIAMCGGINLAISDSQSASRSGKIRPVDTGSAASRKSIPGLAYHAGRILSYTLIGGLAGALGSIISFSESARQAIMLIAGLFMILMGARMLGLFRRLPQISLPIPKSFGRWLYKIRGSSPFIVGLLNGLMPCGPLQTMQIYALGTASMLTGALAMFFFSVGTVPLMLGLSMAAVLLRRKKQELLRTASAILIVFLGLQMASRVLPPLTIPVPSWLQTQSSSQVSSIAVIGVDGHQEVHSSLPGGRYQPLVVQVGIPVRWVITAAANEINGCNHRFQIDGFAGEILLEPGETIVTFTPRESGTIRYACWMNMIVSQINVVDDVLAESANAPYNGNRTDQPNGSGG